MSDITHPGAVKFSTERIRMAADKLSQMYVAAKAITFLWAVRGMGSLIPNDASPIIDDLPPSIPSITGADANAIVGLCAAFVADYEANGFAKIGQAAKVAVKPGV